MTVNKLRSLFYRAARVLGDIQAARRGRILQRIENRLVGKTVRRMTKKLWR